MKPIDPSTIFVNPKTKGINFLIDFPEMAFSPNTLSFEPAHPLYQYIIKKFISPKQVMTYGVITELMSHATLLFSTLVYTAGLHSLRQTSVMQQVSGELAINNTVTQSHASAILYAYSTLSQGSAANLAVNHILRNVVPSVSFSLYLTSDDRLSIAIDGDEAMFNIVQFGGITKSDYWEKLESPRNQKLVKADHMLQLCLQTGSSYHKAAKAFMIYVISLMNNVTPPDAVFLPELGLSRNHFGFREDFLCTLSDHQRRGIEEMYKALARIPEAVKLSEKLL